MLQMNIILQKKKVKKKEKESIFSLHVFPLLNVNFSIQDRGICSLKFEPLHLHRVRLEHAGNFRFHEETIVQKVYDILLKNV